MVLVTRKRTSRTKLGDPPPYDCPHCGQSLASRTPDDERTINLHRIFHVADSGERARLMNEWLSQRHGSQRPMVDRPFSLHYKVLCWARTPSRSVRAEPVWMGRCDPVLIGSHFLRRGYVKQGISKVFDAARTRDILGLASGAALPLGWGFLRA